MTMSPDQDDLPAAEGVFRAYLSGRGLKYTRERRAILRGVMSNERHFEAEQLLIDLRAAGSRVARATIYRTLPLLADCGIIKRERFGEKHARYEHTYGHKPHDHMVCRNCGRIIEFDSSQVARLAGLLARRQGFRALSHRFQIVGLCPQCSEKNAPDASATRAGPAISAPKRRRGSLPDEQA